MLKYNTVMNTRNMLFIQYWCEHFVIIVCIIIVIVIVVIIVFFFK